MPPARDRDGETQHRDQGTGHPGRSPHTAYNRGWRVDYCRARPIGSRRLSGGDGGGIAAASIWPCLLGSHIDNSRGTSIVFRLLPPLSAREPSKTIFAFGPSPLVSSSPQTSDLIHFDLVRRSAEEGIPRWGHVWIASDGSVSGHLATIRSLTRRGDARETPDLLLGGAAAPRGRWLHE